MAKIHSSFISVQGTIAGMTYVRSKYGVHVRRPRGTFKPSRLNATLQSNSRQTKYLNQVAKPIHDYIKQNYQSFKQNDLWQQLQRRLRRAATASLPELHASLQGIEINSRYPLQSKVAVQAPHFTWHKKHCIVTLHFNSHVHYQEPVKADCYYYMVHLLWMDVMGQCCGQDAIETEWLSFSDAVPSYELRFPRPAPASYYVLLLSLHGGQRQKPIEMFAAMAMCVLATGSADA